MRTQRFRPDHRYAPRRSRHLPPLTGSCKCRCSAAADVDVHPDAVATAVTTKYRFAMCRTDCPPPVRAPAGASGRKTQEAAAASLSRQNMHPAKTRTAKSQTSTCETCHQEISELRFAIADRQHAVLLRRSPALTQRGTNRPAPRRWQNQPKTAHTTLASGRGLHRQHRVNISMY